MDYGYPLMYGATAAGALIGAGYAGWRNRRKRNTLRRTARRGQFSRNFRRPYARSRRFRKGKDRTGGFWGRYNKGFQRSSGVELKFHPTTDDPAVAAANNWNISGSLINIAQGTSEVQRIGRKCTLKSISTHIHFFLNSTADETNGHDTVIFKLIWDKQCNGVIPPIADVIETTNNHLSFNNLANSGRFVTLWSRLLNISVTAAGGNGTAIELVNQGQTLQVYKKLNLPIEYNGTTGTTTEIESNNLFYIAVSRHGLVDWTSITRIRFTG